MSLPLIGLLLAVVGALVAAAGALWGMRSSAIDRSLVPVRVTGFSDDGTAGVRSLHSPDSPDGMLELVDPGLIEGDRLLVRPVPGSPGTYRPRPRSWSPLWISAIGFGTALLVLGIATAVTRDAGDELPLWVPLFGGFFFAMPFLMMGLLAGRAGYLTRGTRSRGRIVAFRNHPFIRVNNLPASQAQITYQTQGGTRRAWSKAAYATSLSTGRPVTLWVSDRSPVDIMTISSLFVVAGVLYLACGVAGGFILVISLLVH